MHTAMNIYYLDGNINIYNKRIISNFRKFPNNEEIHPAVNMTYPAVNTSSPAVNEAMILQ